MQVQGCGMRGMQGCGRLQSPLQRRVAGAQMLGQIKTEEDEAAWDMHGALGSSNPDETIVAGAQMLGQIKTEEDQAAWDRAWGIRVLKP